MISRLGIKRVLPCVVLTALLPLTLPAQAPSWRPEKPITLIVPRGAGAPLDQVARLCAGLLESKLGQRIIVVNQPGLSGSVGTKTVLDALRDGYTWASGSIADIGMYKLQGLLDTVMEDWHMFLCLADLPVFAVRASSPYREFGALLEAFRQKPGQIAVATAGYASAGHVAIETLRRYAGTLYRHVPYNDSTTAVNAVISANAEVVSQIAAEESDLMRLGRLRPLAVLDSRPLSIKGLVDPVPPITNWVPGYKPNANYFGIFLPREVPEEVLKTLERLWDEVIAEAPQIAKLALERGALFSASYGEEAAQRALSCLQAVAWLSYDIGRIKISPDTVGIPRQ